MMCNGVKEIPAEEAQATIKEALELVNSQLHPETFLKTVEDASGLLLEREAGLYSFAHLTLQEYLAATYIRDNMLAEALKKEVETSWWHETIRLYCAQGDATPILTTCLANNPPSIPALILALDCQEEALEVQPTASAQLDKLLKQGVEDPDPERRRIVAEALLARRLREMVHVKDTIYIDSSFITRAEYQVFLDEQQALGESYRPDHWKEGSFPSGEARTPVLGVRPSDATTFCDWLSQREKGLWRYRLPKVGEYQEKGEKIIKQSRADIGYWLDHGEFAWLKETLNGKQSLT